MLLFIGYWGLLGLIIIGIVIFMVLIGLHYFFIKRAKLYFHMLEKLKKNAGHLAPFQQRGTIEKNAALDTKTRLLSFKQSMLLWPKEFKIICVLSLLMVLLRAALLTANTAGWKGDVSGVIILLLSCLSEAFLFLAPIVGLLCLKLTGKLRKTIQQWEEEIVQQDKRISMQNALGGKND
ncbi:MULTISPECIES: hypothetical protein [unclassified Bartonella]|uniref:hypothetical protein n=1 Tax=unclassified Bartonella TaxID=2645622 RepID=UPI002362A6D3|nr:MULTISPECIES: hypothetical protein [unclassified Bartonella]